jgi:hypothetical protein
MARLGADGGDLAGEPVAALALTERVPVRVAGVKEVVARSGDGFGNKGWAGFVGFLREL